MSHGVPYFDWNHGRPRWMAPKRLRDAGVLSMQLKDAAGNWLGLASAMAAAHYQNQRHGVRSRLPATWLEQRQEEAKRGYVYFVLAGESMKVGYSAEPFARTADVVNGTAVRPSLVIVVPGSRTDESRVHEMFAADRLNREWFAASTRLINLAVRSAKLRRVSFGQTEPKTRLGAGEVSP